MAGLDSPITIAPEEDQGVYLPDNSLSPSPVLPSADTASSRAQKAAIGLGSETKQTRDDFERQIMHGQEQRLREGAVSSLNDQRYLQREQALIDARNKKGSPLSYDEALHLIDPYNPAFKPAEVHNVIERAYADKFISMANTASSYMRDTYLTEAEQNIPDVTAQSKSNLGTFVGQMEFARTLKQNIDDEIHNQNWIPYTIDFVKNMFQTYPEIKMRNITGYQFEGLGSAMKRKADELFMGPDFEKNLLAIIDPLRKDNPQLASEFLDYVLGASANQRHLQNFFTVLAPLDYTAAVKGSKSLLRAIELNNRVNTGFKQLVTAAAKADGKEVPIRAAVAEALGDLPGAAAVRASNHIESLINGKYDPIKDAKESLPSHFRLDGDLLDSAPGPLSRSQLTDMKDSFYKAGTNLVDTLMSILRVNRTLEPLTDNAARTAWVNAQKAQYGKELLDISSPIKNPLTNTYDVEYHMGNSFGQLFSDPDTAYNHARIKGWAQPVIRSAEGTVERVTANLSATRSDLAARAQLQQSIPRAEALINRLKGKIKTSRIGPKLPGESISELKATLSTAESLLLNMRQRLEAVNKRVSYTQPVIEQHGLGYKYIITRPFRETDDVVRDYLNATAESKSSATQGEGWSRWFNSFAGKFRSADDTLAYNESMNRKIATYTNKVIAQWGADIAKDIEAISNQTKWYTPWTWYRPFTRKDMFNEFNQVLDVARKMEDPKTGELGYFFKTPKELDDYYQTYFKRNVTYPEVKAYFAHVKLIEGNRILTEIAEFRNRARLGAEQHNLFLLSPAGKISSGFFDGVIRPDLPRSGGQILFMGPRKGDERLYHLGANEVPGKMWEKWNEAVSTGKAKVIEIYDPDSHPLSGFVNVGNERIRYIVTSDVETKPLSFNHVNRRGGGHFDYVAPQYIKQAKISDETIGDALSDKRRVFKRIYVGDNTLLAGTGSLKLDTEIANKMTKMNELMRTSKLQEAKDLAKTLGIEWSKIEEWYDPNRYLNGRKVGPLIDWNEPFYVVPRNKRVWDVDTKGLVDRVNNKVPDSFQDASKTGSLAKQFQVEYTQARDAESLYTIRDVGSSGNPIYKMEAAKMTDPIPTMTKAFNRAVRSTFMDDYKISAVEHWLQEAQPYLKADRDEIRSAPFYHFHNADEGAFTTGTSKEIINNLISNRFKIQQFIGMPSATETAIQGATQRLVDSFYERFGPEESRGALTKALTIIPLNMLSRWRDPVSGIRSLAFNANLGFFSIPQFLVQAQTFANVWALGGRSGANGTFGAMLHQWSRINKSEGFMNAYDNLYTKLNFFGSKPQHGEFIEANKELAKTGFEHVGNDYVLKDTAMEHKLFTTTAGNFLNAGQVFFTEGEKFTRLGAWYTAFREFREANPVRAITDADRANILQRADLFTANMSRASASSLNAGWLSLPMQFLTYQMRMAELFWGKRITKTDKARLLGVYAAMYGAPGALGVTGYPFIDSIREGAMNHGYVSGDNQIYDAIMNGLISWQMALISGKGDYGKGSIYDVQSRWGTQGLSQISETLRSDKTIWSFVGGAGVDTLWKSISNLEPFWQFAWQMMSEDEEGNRFKITPAHFNQLFSFINEEDLASRSIAAIHSGRWLSKNGQYLTDTTPAEVLWRNITGLKTVEETDISRFRDIHRAEKDFQDKQQREIEHDFRRGMDAVSEKDYDTATTFFANARARTLFSGMPIERRAEAFSKAMKNYEAESVRSSWQWATQNVPYGMEQQRLEMEQRRNAVRQYRNQ
jgi:hypothetical protein